jgi:hypothetical protein
MASNHDLVAKLVPGGVHSLAHLDDQELLSNTRRLVGKSNQLFAALLLHLAEVETRGLHRQRLCASLYTYCIYELRFSEDAAARRSSAARLVKQFPLLFDAIAGGELHLTGLLMLGPHLTPENHVEVEEHVKLVERAKALLVRERPGLALGEVHLEAMKMLVAALEKRKFAVTDRPRKPARAPQAGADAARSDDVAAPEAPAEPRQSSLTPRRRGRYVPAAERREVFERDGGRCSYVDSNGGRCRETRYLELHHLKPFAQGGVNLASNLTLRCAAHNALAAEEDFGREYVEQKRGHARHESLAAQADPLDSA